MKLTADAVYDKCTDISPQSLKKAGVRLVLTDLDNTLENYKAWSPRSEIKEWAAEFQKYGLVLFVITNNKRERGRAYLEDLGVPYICCADKPKPTMLLKAMKQFNAKPEETVMIGDQVFTDVLAGKRAGIRTLLVRPIDLSNPLRAARYFIEQPFIARARRRGSANRDKNSY